jgi:hypothetical protein
MTNALQTWVMANVTDDPTRLVALATLQKRFYDDLPTEDRGQWPRSRVISTLTGLGYILGRLPGRGVRIANVSLDPDIEPKRWKAVDGMLVWSD